MPDGGGRRVSVHDDQARRVSMAQPSERVAACASPLLVVRASRRRPTRHPDVLPGRSLASARSDLRLGSRPGGAATAGGRVRPRRDRTRPRPRVSLRHRRRRTGCDTGGSGVNETPSQTVGPFFSIGLGRLAGEGDGPLELSGRVLDGDGEPVPDALVETVASGSFRRAFTDDDGRYRVRIESPPTGEGQQPFVELSVFARGLLQRVVTRAYLADGADPLLDALPSQRRATLLAEVDAAGTSARFDIHLQGEQETVFLAW